MTIKECIDIVDNAKPNQYGIKEEVMWLSFVDETIINDVLKTHEGYDGRYDDFEGYTEDKLSVPLIVPSPYDRLYPQYIKMMIDSENGETARYNNSSALYNTYLNEYKKYYNKTHMPLNATQKIPSPVSININSHLSEAQIEYIKRQLYYMLSEDFSEATSRDKLYDIVTNYVLNNLEMIRANDGKDGKDGKDGTLWIPFKFDVDIKKGEKKLAEFDFSRNIFKFGDKTYDDLDKNDYPDIYEWAVGDFFVSNNGNVLRITRLEWLNSEMLNLDTECILEFTDIVVDQTYNPLSRNAMSGRAASEAFVAMDEYKANTDLSNVDNAVFAAKAEEAGIGNAGLAGEASGGFKKIGFTADCDYIATESDGHSAFNQAVSEANDGDVIVVMSGTYNGSYTLAIEKNITFVGIGKPIIKFPIIIGSYTQANTVNFDNFEFGNNMQCRAVDEWTPSKLFIYNSRFNNSTTVLIGTFSNCKFDTATVSGAVAYAGDETNCAVNYNDCDIIDSTMGGDSAWYRNCTIRESYTPGGYSVYYTGCLLYNFTNKMNAAYQTALMRCVLYGNALPDGYNPTEYHECYLVSGVAL